MLPKHELNGVTHAIGLWWTGKQGIVATQYATSDDEDLGTLVLTNPGAVVSLIRPICASPHSLLLLSVNHSVPTAHASCPYIASSLLLRETMPLSMQSRFLKMI